MVFSFFLSFSFLSKLSAFSVYLAIFCWFIYLLIRLQLESKVVCAPKDWFPGEGSMIQHVFKMV